MPRIHAPARAISSVSGSPSAPIALTITTPRGATHGLWWPARSNRAAVALLPGADGALSGPAGLYDDLAETLRGQVAVARLGYRWADGPDAARDTILAALEALHAQGVERVALIGWDAGARLAAMVAATAAPVSAHIAGVALLAPDAAATATLTAICPPRLAPDYGTGGPDISTGAAVLLSALAGEGADLAVYPGESHDFARFPDTRAALAGLLSRWTVALLATPFHSGVRLPSPPREAALAGSR